MPSGSAISALSTSACDAPGSSGAAVPAARHLDDLGERRGHRESENGDQHHAFLITSP
jgi:hypothetical protein